MHQLNTKLSKVSVIVGVLLSIAAETAKAQTIADNTAIAIPGGYTSSSATNDTPELYALNSGTISSPGALTITTSGGNSEGVRAESGGTVSLNGTSEITTNGGDASGLKVDGNGSSVTSTGNMNIIANGGSNGVYALNGGKIDISGGTLNVSANGDASINGPHSAIEAAGNGTTVTINSGGLLQTTSLLPSSGGVNSSAVSASNGATVILNGTPSSKLNIQTAGELAHGIVMDANGAGTTVQGSNLAISTSGVNANGVYVGDNFTLTDSTVNTSGVDADAVKFLGSNSSGVIQNTAITATGNSANGIAAIAGGSAELNNISLNTSGDDSFSISAANGSTVSSTGQLNINATGLGSGAVYADSNSEININDQFNIVSTGDDASAIYATNNSIINLSGSGVIEKNAPSTFTTTAAIYAATGSDITLNGSAVQLSTSGANVHGVYVEGTGDSSNPTTVNLAGTSITTTGTGALGAYAINPGAVLDISNSNINTKNSSSAGLMARDGAVANITQSEIVTEKPISAAIRAVSGGSINATDSTFRTAESDSPGVSLEGGSATLVNSTITTTGSTRSPAIMQYRGDSKLSMSGGELSSLSGESIYAADGTADIDLNNVQAIENNGIFLQNAGSAVLNVKADSGSSLSGDAVNTSSSTASLALNNGSRWTGKSVDMTNIDVNSNSIWNVTGDSTSENLTLNSGTINFQSNSISAVKSITVNELSGTNGTINFNTVLNEGDTQTISDKIIVNNNASGTYNININSIGGNGSQTVNDGIKLASINGQDTTSIRLAKPVVAGAYEYLAYNGGQSGKGWYLRSTLEPTVDPLTPVDPTTPVTPASNNNPKPSYNPSVPGYAIAPYLNRMYGYQTVGTLHERVGEQENIKKENDMPQGAWGRIGGGETKSNADRFNYDADTWFAQLGADLYTKFDEDGTRVHSGIFATFGQVSTSAKDADRATYMNRSVNTGKINSKGYGVGGYYTSYFANDIYIDTVAQYTHYRNDYSSIYGSNASQDGDGMTLSLETGKPFKFSNGWYIEPQAQIMYQYLHLDSVSDGVVKVKSTSDNSGLARVGGRVGYDSVKTSKAHPYLTANVLSNIGRSPDVTISSVRLNQDYSDQWYEVGGGFTGDITKNASLYADMKYQHDFEGDMHGFSGNLGLRVNW